MLKQIEDLKAENAELRGELSAPAAAPTAASPLVKAPLLLRAAPKRKNSSAAFVPHGRSTSGAVQPAAPLPEDRPEKRLARNNTASTKKAVMAFNGRGQRAEQEWAAAQRLVGAGPVSGLTPRVRAGAMNALTGRVMPTAEKIVEEMYKWYNDRTDEGSLDEVFRNLHNALFKHVKVQLKDD